LTERFHSRDEKGDLPMRLVARTVIVIILTFGGLAGPRPMQAAQAEAPDRPGLSCHRLTDKQLPALMFIEGTYEQSSLCVTTFGGGKAARSTLISGGNVDVTRLGRMVFLVNTDKSSEGGTVYAMNLATGALKELFRDKNICCLRSEPGRGVAMLAEWDKESIRLIELDLNTFATQPKGQIRRQAEGAAGGAFMVPTKIRISPDFSRIAYVHTGDASTTERESRYTLSVIELHTMKSQDIAKDVCVELPSISSWSYGLPPFEWLNDDEIVYQDMKPVADANEGIAWTDIHVFKTVNVRTKAVTEIFRQDRRMALDGGSMTYDPATGKIVYNREWFLDMHVRGLVPKNLPFAASQDYKATETTIMWGEKVLYRGNEHCLGTCISPSGLNFAYMIRPRRETLVGRIYTKVDGVDKPIQVAEGSFAPTSAVAWIEDR
jgi:hypothetical protein